MGFTEWRTRGSRCNWGCGGETLDFVTVEPRFFAEAGARSAGFRWQLASVFSAFVRSIGLLASDLAAYRPILVLWVVIVSEWVWGARALRWGANRRLHFGSLASLSQAVRMSVRASSRLGNVVVALGVIGTASCCGRSRA